MGDVVIIILFGALVVERLWHRDGPRDQEHDQVQHGIRVERFAHP